MCVARVRERKRERGKRERCARRHGFQLETDLTVKSRERHRAHVSGGTRTNHVQTTVLNYSEGVHTWHV